MPKIECVLVNKFPAPLPGVLTYPSSSSSTSEPGYFVFESKSHPTRVNMNQTVSLPVGTVQKIYWSFSGPRNVHCPASYIEHHDVRKSDGTPLTADDAKPSVSFFEMRFVLASKTEPTTSTVSSMSCEENSISVCYLLEKYKDAILNAARETYRVPIVRETIQTYGNVYGRILMSNNRLAFRITNEDAEESESDEEASRSDQEGSMSDGSDQDAEESESGEEESGEHGIGVSNADDADEADEDALDDSKFMFDIPVSSIIHHNATKTLVTLSLNTKEIEEAMRENSMLEARRGAVTSTAANSGDENENNGRDKGRKGQDNDDNNEDGEVDELPFWMALFANGTLKDVSFLVPSKQSVSVEQLIATLSSNETRKVFSAKVDLNYPKISDLTIEALEGMTSIRCFTKNLEFNIDPSKITSMYLVDKRQQPKRGVPTNPYTNITGMVYAGDSEAKRKPDETDADFEARMQKLRERKEINREGRDFLTGMNPTDYLFIIEYAEELLVLNKKRYKHIVIRLSDSELKNFQINLPLPPDEEGIANTPLANSTYRTLFKRCMIVPGWNLFSSSADTERFGKIVLNAKGNMKFLFNRVDKETIASYVAESGKTQTAIELEQLCIGVDEKISPDSLFAIDRSSASRRAANNTGNSGENDGQDSNFMIGDQQQDQLGDNRIGNEKTVAAANLKLTIRDAPSVVIIPRLFMYMIYMQNPKVTQKAAANGTTGSGLTYEDLMLKCSLAKQAKILMSQKAYDSFHLLEFMEHIAARNSRFLDTNTCIGGIAKRSAELPAFTTETLKDYGIEVAPYSKYLQVVREHKPSTSCMFSSLRSVEKEEEATDKKIPLTEIADQLEKVPYIEAIQPTRKCCSYLFFFNVEKNPLIIINKKLNDVSENYTDLVTIQQSDILGYKFKNDIEAATEYSLPFKDSVKLIISVKTPDGKPVHASFTGIKYKIAKQLVEELTSAKQNIDISEFKECTRTGYVFTDEDNDDESDETGSGDVSDQSDESDDEEGASDGGSSDKDE